jgi:hypothetical protein
MTNKIYDLKHLKVSQETISFELSGCTINVPLVQCGSKSLLQAKPEHLQIFEVDEDGIGIHWPVLDEDLSIAGLLRSAGQEQLIVQEIPSVYVDEPVPSKAKSAKRRKRYAANKLTIDKLA